MSEETKKQATKKVNRRTAASGFAAASLGISNLSLGRKQNSETQGSLSDSPKITKFHEGLKSCASYPLLSAIFNRRSRRIMQGIPSVKAGSMDYQSDQPVLQLDEIEEALLIAMTGPSGLTMPDRPFQDESGNNILGTPNVRMGGRTAGSADNAQNTHFFMINDEGVFYLDHLKPQQFDVEFSPDRLISYADSVKVKISDKRLDFPRQFPYYFDSNRFLSNLPGSTVFLPVVDISIQYINGIMYLLTGPEGRRPVFVDDRNGFVPAGVERWIKNGFLNPEITLPLSLLNTFRAHIESSLLLQNMMLTLQAMGLGGWIHASFEGPFLLGHPSYRLSDNPGLDFEYVIPKQSPVPVPDLNMLANPVGKKGIIECYCPPWYATMSDAVDALLDLKYAPGGTYNNPQMFGEIFKDKIQAQTYLNEAPPYSPTVVQVCKDVCEYIYRTHGRFPAHEDAIHVPGIWLQAQHIDQKYYEKYFRDGLTSTHRNHIDLWHKPR